MEVISHRLKAL